MLASITKERSLPSLLGILLIVISLVALAPAYAQTSGANPPTGTSQPAGVSGTNPPAAPAASTVAQGVPTAADMIQNLSKQIPAVRALILAIAYVIGIVLIIMGIMRLKHVGEMRTMMSHEHSLKGPIVYLAVGAMLIYFPSTVSTGLSTFWTSPNPYGYVIQSDQWTQFVGTCLSIIQLFGVIAFIRGLIMLSQLAGHGGGHQGGLGKSLTHIIGGIFCINIYQFVQVVMVTLGIQSPFK